MRRIYQWKPSKWLIWAPLMAGLPALAAGWITSPPLWQDLEQRANAALTENSGLKVTMEGRDAVITGDAATKAKLEAAINAVSSTYGVRRVDATRAAIAPAARLSAPTVKILVTTDSSPILTGTWPEDPANALSISLGDKIYELGKEKTLTTTGGNWSLAVPTIIPDGKYDVVVSVSDGSGTTSSVKAAAGLTIDSTAPAAPKLAPSPEKITWPFAITGTWPEADSASFAIEFHNKTYELGVAPELKGDGKGNFTFDPKISLTSGKYDLRATLKDKLGNEVTHLFPGAVVIADPSLGVTPDLSIPKEALMPTPTVRSIKTFAAHPVLRGTWPANAATDFKVEVGGHTYELGRTPSLLDDAFGNWMLKVDKPLTPGTYDVDAIATDASNISIRDVTKGELVIKPSPPKPPSMVTPTVAKIATGDAAPQLSGTWDAKTGKALRIEVAGMTHELGKSKALSTDSSGNWTLNLTKPLLPGTYDVDAISTDALRISIRDVTGAELVINQALLPSPAIDAVQSDSEVTSLSGTWQLKEAKSLRVTAAGKSYELGKSPNLTSDTSGKWMLKLENPLSDGTYDIEATALGDGDRSSGDTTKNEIVIALPPPPPPPVKLGTPSIRALETRDPTPVITGTWPEGPEGNATNLAVKIGNKNYVLGQSPALKSINGAWSLTLPVALADGAYDVEVKISDGQGNVESANSPRGLIIDTLPPAAPKLLAAAANAKWPYPVSGKWPETDAISLSIDFNGKTYLLGANDELTSGGNGVFTFAPNLDLKPGAYDMKVAMADRLGNAAEFPISKAVVIPDPPRAPETAPETAPEPAAQSPVPKPSAKKPVETVLQTTGYDCATDLERISHSFPVRFEYRKSEITSLHEFTLSQVAALLRDPRCKGLKIEIEGHTDFRGTFRYNQLLSELRAERVVRALVQGGVPGSRLRPVGHSEAIPMDTARTDAARAKNRRVEFRIIR